MLYSNYRGSGGNFRGKIWKLPNGYTRACNHKGQQCTFKLYNEAKIFAEKNAPKFFSEAKKFTPGQKVKIIHGSGINSGKTGVIVSRNAATATGELDKRVDWSKEEAIRLDSGETITMFKNRISISEAKEVTLQAVRFRHEADQMASQASQLSGVISTHVKELSNGHFQPVLVMKEGAVLQEDYRGRELPDRTRKEMTDRINRLEAELQGNPSSQRMAAGVRLAKTAFKHQFGTEFKEVAEEEPYKGTPQSQRGGKIKKAFQPIPVEEYNTRPGLASMLGYHNGFKLAKEIPHQLRGKVPPRGWDTWIKGNKVVLTNANAWQAWTLDGKKLGSGRENQFDSSVVR